MKKSTRKFIKRIFTACLSILIVLSGVPLNGFVDLELPRFSAIKKAADSASDLFDTLSVKVSAATNEYYSFYINNEKVTISSVDTSINGNITIPQMLDGYPVTRIDNYAFNGCSNLESITILSGVTSIGNRAFQGCTGLTSIKLPNSIKAIGDEAFYNCYSLTSITIPDSVISIGESTFDFCTNLTSVSIGDSVTSIGNSFYDCDSLTSVSIGNSVTSIDNSAFKCCDSLTNITVDSDNDYYSNDEYGVLFNKDKTELIQYPASNTNTNYIIPDSVKNIDDDAFYNCSNLKNIIIPNSVTNIGYSAFLGCTSLTNITLPDGVTNIGGFAFRGCSKLTSITIPDSVTSIGESTFDFCTNLASVTIPDSVTSIGGHAFCGCSSLASITIPDSVTSIGGSAFINCSSLTSVFYMGDVAGWCAINFEDSGSTPMQYRTTLYINGNLIDKNLVIPSSVTTIGNYAFNDYDSLTSVTIPDSVTSIGNSAFQGCTGLASIKLPNSIKAIGDEAFYNCDSLTDITIPDSVTSIGASAFEGCDSLTNVIIPNSVISVGAGVFSNCESLTTATIGSSVTTIGYRTFYNCKSLANVMIGNSVTNIGKSSFDGCSSLASITIGNGVTSIDDYAFYKCTNLTSITIPDSVVSIGEQAFYGCSSLADIIIGNNVTNIDKEAFLGTEVFNNYSNWENDVLYISNCLIKAKGTISGVYNIKDGTKTVADGAFCECKDLSEITVPNSVKSMGIAVFNNYPYSSLTNVYYKGDIADWCNINFSDKTSNPLYYIDNLYINGNLIDENLVIPDSVISIGNYAFYNCSGLTSVTIPESVTSIGDYAFFSCDELSNVIIGNRVTIIGEKAFSACEIKKIVIPDSVSIIGDSAFSDCYNLTNITIGSNVKSIGLNAFEKRGSYGNELDLYFTGTVAEWCNIKMANENSNPMTFSTTEKFYINNELLTDLIIPDNITSVGSFVFANCGTLKTLTIPDHVSNLGTGAFSYCCNLEKITLGKGVKNIYKDAFSKGYGIQMDIYYTGNIADWCEIKFENAYSNPKCWISSNLYIEDSLVRNIIIPENVTNINDYAFYNCSSLENVTIPDSVTSIGISAFESCTNLSYVEFTNNVKKIEEGAFINCKNLIDICFIGTESEWYNINIADYGNSHLTYANIYHKDVYELKIYSPNPSMFVAPNEKKLIYFSLFKYKDKVDKWENYTITQTDNSVVKITDAIAVQSETPNMPKHLIVLEGLTVGKTKITITDNQYGAVLDFTITVSEYADQFLSFSVDNVPDYMEEQLLAKDIPINFYTNGLYVTDYTYKESYQQTGYDITFNVYNLLVMHGSVDVYDKDGKLLKCYKIDKHETLPDVISAGGYILYDIVNPDEFFSFTSKKDSVKTEMSFFVPEGGYFIIGNNALVSPATLLYNAIDLVSTLSDMTYSKEQTEDEILEAFLSDDMLQKCLRDAACDTLSEDTVLLLEPDVWMGSLSILKGVLTKLIESISLEDATKSVINNAITSIPIIEEPLSIVFETLGLVDLVCQVICCRTSYKHCVASVYSTNSYELSSAFGVCAKYNQDTFKDSENIVLHVFRVANDSLTQKADLSCSDYISYNICFLQNGTECQPNEKIEVRIPLPNEYNPNNIKLLHETNETESGFEELYFQVIDGYIVFETDHFSLFTVALTNSNYDFTSATVCFKTKKIDSNAGNILKLELVTEPNNLPSNRIVWKSSNEDVVSIIENGIVLAKSPGTAVISAETIDGSSIDCCEIVVSEKKYKTMWIVDGTTTEYNVTEGSNLIVPEISEKTGYTFTGWIPAVPEIMPAEDLTFTAVFEANSYDAVFDANGGVWSDGATTKTVSAKYDSQIVSPKIPTKHGYIFSGWSPDVGIMDNVNGKMFTAEWIPATDTRYSVETYTMNTEGEYKKSIKTFSGTTGESVTTEYTVPDGFTLNSEMSLLEGIISADSSLVLKVYLDRNIYTFTSVVDGVSTETEYYYGSTLSEPLMPEKAGYKFTGWDNPIPLTMPANDLTITAKFELVFEMSIRNPSVTSVNYGDKIILHADMSSTLPNGWKIKWTANNGNFEYSTSADGSTCTISPSSKGDTTFTATVYDENENEICSDTQSMTSKAGFFDKIIAFFKKLFGLTKTIPQIYKNII